LWAPGYGRCQTKSTAATVRLPTDSPRIGIAAGSAKGLTRKELEDFQTSLMYVAEASSGKYPLLLIEDAGQTSDLARIEHWAEGKDLDKVLIVDADKTGDSLSYGVGVLENKRRGGPQQVNWSGTHVTAFTPATNVVLPGEILEWLLRILSHVLEGRGALDLLIVTIPGGVDLILDETRLGITPDNGSWRGQFFRRPGRYRLKASKSCYESEEREVQVSKKAVSVISLELKLKKISTCQ